MAGWFDRLRRNRLQLCDVRQNVIELCRESGQLGVLQLDPSQQRNVFDFLRADNPHVRRFFLS